MDSFESLARSDTLHNRICLLRNRQGPIVFKCLGHVCKAELTGLLVCKRVDAYRFPPPAKCQKLCQTDTVVFLFGVPTLKAPNG